MRRDFSMHGRPKREGVLDFKIFATFFFLNRRVFGLRGVQRSTLDMNSIVVKVGRGRFGHGAVACLASGRRFRSIIEHKRLYSLSEKQLYGRRTSNPRVATLEKEVEAPTPLKQTPDEPRIADIVPLKQRSVEDRLNDPNLLFEGEDEVPSAHINMIKGMRDSIII